jgi:hypothetical protein
MSKLRLAAALVAALIAFSPSPFMPPAAAAQAAQPATSGKKKAKKPPTPGQLAARARQKKCAAEWKAAKAAGKVEKGMTWPKYWSACNKRLKPATSAKTKAKKPPTAGQLAARARQKKCAAEWKQAKAAGKIEKGMTWPKYWSACNKRLKAAGG